VLGLLLLSSLGCAGSKRPAVEQPFSVPATRVDAAETAESEPATTGEVVHVVQPGQTMWRIARTYGLTPEELARANGIQDPTCLEVGQALVIPGASTVLEVPEAFETIESPSRSGTVQSDWIWPVPRGEIISYFGAPRRGHAHGGIDIRGARGDMVFASRAGRVVYSGSGMRGYGKTVIVDHGDGYSSLYAHNSKLLVQVGQRVERGQPIARVGRSGNASGEHCHFEIRHNDNPVDPLLHLFPPVEARR
jgi:murein DD-endopeptidase MepM/ murein hydrolase activator NlpD